MLQTKRILIPAALTAALTLTFAAIAQTPPAASSAASTAKTATTKTTTAKPTAADIADAKSKGLVWCNTNTKVYHLADSKFYGNTSKGKFMTTADAQKAGFKQAKDNPTSKKKPAATTTATTPAK